jgi:hypothetical protein
MFRSLQKIIDDFIDIKNKNIKQLENKQLENKQLENKQKLINLDQELIKQAFIEQLDEYYNNRVITLSDLRVKKITLNGITYVFFNPIKLKQEINKSKIKYNTTNDSKFTFEYYFYLYYYRYIVYVQDNQLMCKEIFLDPQTSKISIRQIDIGKINKANLEKLNKYSKKLINYENKNLSIQNIYNKVKMLNQAPPKNQPPPQEFQKTWVNQSNKTIRYAIT